MEDGDFATVALIHRPHGRHGEVSVELFTDFPDRFEAGSKVFLWRSGEPRRETLTTSPTRTPGIEKRIERPTTSVTRPVVRTADVLASRAFSASKSMARPAYRSFLHGAQRRTAAEFFGPGGCDPK